MLSGCRKEDMYGGIKLMAENFTTNGTKTAVNGTAVNWLDGDQVRLNGQTGTVHISSSEAYATGIESIEGVIRGYYPASIITSSNAENENTDNPTVVFPSVYSSTLSGGQQSISLPMIGKADEGATSIRFYHLSAAIKVRVKNLTETDNTIYLDSIVVVSATQQLCGPANVSNNGSSTTVSGASNDAQYRRVKVKFKDGVSISYNSFVDVQVPILPIAEVDGNDITFKVYTHKPVARTGMPTVNYSYDYSRALHCGALGRNVLATTQIAVTKASTDNSHTTEVDHSLFTVNRTGSGTYTYTKVRFSKGNLQYRASDNYWRFAEHQYDYIGDNPGNNADTTTRKAQTDYIDLFMWASSGWTIKPYLRYPMSTSRFPTSNIEGTNYDWGVFNSISNGGNTAWRTLKNIECSHLLISGRADCPLRYMLAKIGSTYGLIVFPDHYIHPDEAIALTNVNSAVTWANCYNATEYWNKMEQAGAVFLPAAGYGDIKSTNGALANTVGVNNVGWYWTTTYSSPSSKTSALKIVGGQVPNTVNTSSSNNNLTSRHYCCAVRLVTTVE